MISFNMDLIQTSLLALHVAGGSLALAAGLVPMLSKKGSNLHVLGGRIYLWCMAAVVASALPLAVMKANVFLATIGVFSGYMVFTGYRSARRRSAAPSSPADQIVMWVTMAVSALMIATAIWYLLGPNTKIQAGIILLVFGSFCHLLTWEDFRATKQAKSRPWLQYHLSRFVGAYISTFTAFAVVNLSMLPALLVWLGPSLLGGFLIAQASRKWAKQR